MLKNNLPIISLIFLLIILLSIFFSIIAYKASCTLDQIVDWNAVSALTSIFLALCTLVAITIAIFVPMQDRNIMSKIELFNKRFEAYFYFFQKVSFAFETNKLEYDESELLKMIKQTGYLITRSDGANLIKIIEKVHVKTVKKFKDESHPDLTISIKEETEDLYQLFDKYLNLRNYGVDRNNKKI